jgi:hypothetical protein
VAVFFLMAASAASALDLHAFWDQRCRECHGHAAAFARQFLTVSEGELRGRHPAGDLRLFLRHHGVPPADVEAVYAMLLAQASSEPEFAPRCSGCHGTAAAFARSALAFRDNRLVGREGRPVEEFLPGHMGLTAEEAARFSTLLTRVEREVHRP